MRWPFRRARPVGRHRMGSPPADLPGRPAAVLPPADPAGRPAAVLPPAVADPPAALPRPPRVPAPLAPPRAPAPQVPQQSVMLPRQYLPGQVLLVFRDGSELTIDSGSMQGRPFVALADLLAARR